MQGIVFVYDITNKPSFQHLAKWVSDVDEVRQRALSFDPRGEPVCDLSVHALLCLLVPQYAPDMVQRILVGNKSDDEKRRQVTTEQGSKV